MRLTERFVKRRAVRRRRKFELALEGLGEATSLCARTLRNADLRTGLSHIEKLFHSLMELKEKDIGRYRASFGLENVLDLNDPSSYFDDVQAFDDWAGLHVILQELKRIHSSAMDVRNDYGSRHSTYVLIGLLSTLTASTGNLSAVRQILELIQDFAYRAAQRDDISMHAAGAHWFLSIVFPYRPAVFKLDYLDACENALIRIMRDVVGLGQFELFKSLVSYVHHSHITPLDHRGIWEYLDVLYNNALDSVDAIDRRIELRRSLSFLESSQSGLYSLEDKDSWVKSFAEFRQRAEHHLPEDVIRLAEKKVETVISHVEQVVKFNHVKEAFLAIGAYCLFKRQARFIRYLWDFEQPEDADAHWVCASIIPSTPEGVIEFYFRPDFYERGRFGWEDHHGSSLYYDRYFLLLLMRALGLRRSTHVRNEIDGRSGLPRSWGAQTLSSVRHYVQELTSIASAFNHDSAMAAELGFDAERFADDIQRCVIPLLKNLQEDARSRIDEIERRRSPDAGKIAEFKTDLKAAFLETAKTRQLYVIYSQVEEHLSISAPCEVEPLYIAVLDHKAAFFDSWHDHYSHWGESYGSQFGAQVNKDIYNRLRDRCSRVDPEELFNKLASFGEGSKPVMLVNRRGEPQFWKTEAKIEWMRQAENQSVGSVLRTGHLTCRGITVPIVCVGHDPEAPSALLLDANRLGVLEEYGPSEDLKPDSFEHEGPLSVRIRALSEDTALLKTFMDQAQGESEEEKIAYLEKKVELLLVYASRSIFPDDFAGYAFIPK